MVLHEEGMSRKDLMILRECCPYCLLPEGQVYELNDTREDMTSEESQVGGQGGEDICDEAKSVRAV